QELAEPGWVASRVAEEGSEPSRREPLHLGWRTAYEGFGTNRTAVDQAKSRSERDGELEAFYLLIGYVPPDRRGKPGSIHDRVRRRFPELFEGAIEPAAAVHCRSHMLECSDCFWAFADYAWERAAWGYVERPVLAAFRERWQAFRQRLGDLPADLGELA